ncbi:lamin tail domain-containing protein [Flavisolibacter ginsenosidimutans]|uniref:T9SS type A sorting domain-containing protein n=1 Tax=Flavisolibacter ginsenosidimutans TaxID=661481 RepID=A0A5B8UQG5_9BACT|nr:lamin tail domain-containing protein [Flavisolibacter ginsenosidimutans]QEC58175.1 T9SS type A sorting domain-containing protein [Flavisolibacter ginsenosidimutans]
MRKLCSLLSLLFVFQFSRSQVVINSTGSAYTQNFNSLAQTGTANAWADNSTITGWYSTQTTYRAESGGGNTGALYSYGPSSAPGDVTDRALGLLSSGTTNFRFGVQIKNSTGAAVSSFTIAFTGEEWRQTANAQKLAFEYSTDATSVTSTTATWTPVTSLDFTAPLTGTAGPLDGNAAANRAAISGTVSTSVADNSTIWLRWTKAGTTSPGLAIDDISITANGGTVNSITTGAVSTSPFCIDASTAGTGTVAYSATGTYNTTFTAYLSDASGSFAAPVSVGSITVNGTDPAGNINISIPAGTASGTGYKIRVDATAPAVTGTSSNAFEIVNGAKNVTATSAITGNTQATVNWINPTACFDDVMIVAKASASVTATPSGDGSAYTASNTFGAGTAFGGGYVVYKGTVSPQTVTGLTNGTLYYFKIFTRKGTAWSSGVEVSTTPNTQAGPGDVLINQLSPQYSGASDEYIELINKTNNNIDLSGFAIRYQAGSGSSTSSLGTLSGTLLPNHYWLLSPNANVTVGTTNNLARDGAFTAGMAAASGQIALVRLSDNTVIDAVGYGSITGAGTYTETTAAPAPPTNGGLKRSPDGTDTNNNSADFVTVSNANIALRNSAAGAPLPVKFANLKAVQKAGVIYVSWSNLTESEIKDYTVERSANGSDFVALTKINPTSNRANQADYFVVDAAPARGANFYRIRSTETSGKTFFSNILKLNPSGIVPSLLVYPNPLKGNEAVLQLSNVPAGKYTVQVVGADGRTINLRTTIIAEGSSTESLPANNLTPGFYILKINGPVRLQQYFVKQ